MGRLLWSVESGEPVTVARLVAVFVAMACGTVLVACAILQYDHLTGIEPLSILGIPRTFAPVVRILLVSVIIGVVVWADKRVTRMLRTITVVVLTIGGAILTFAALVVISMIHRANVRSADVRSDLQFSITPGVLIGVILMTTAIATVTATWKSMTAASPRPGPFLIVSCIAFAASVSFALGAFASLLGDWRLVASIALA